MFWNRKPKVETTIRYYRDEKRKRWNASLVDVETGKLVCYVSGRFRTKDEVRRAARKLERLKVVEC